MTKVIARVALGLGRVGYYDEYTRTHLTIANPQRDIYAGMNLSGIRSAVHSGTLRLVTGSLDTGPSLTGKDIHKKEEGVINKPKETPKKKEEPKKEAKKEAPKKEEKVEPKKEVKAEPKKEEPKKAPAKKAEPKKEVKKEAPAKKEAPKKEASKKEEPKKEEKKK